ncbi:hypothetical protein Tco_0362866 [Tanacetum coccineum]
MDARRIEEEVDPDFLSNAYSRTGPAKSGDSCECKVSLASRYKAEKVCHEEMVKMPFVDLKVLEDGSFRMCIYYRELSKIDLYSDCHQMRVHEDEILKTAFRMRYGCYEFMAMPFWVDQCTSDFHGRNESGDVRTLIMEEAHATKYSVRPGVNETVARHGVHVSSIPDKDGMYIETDGQSERTFRTLENMFRACVRNLVVVGILTFREAEIEESKTIGLELKQETTKVVVIKERPKEAKDHQESVVRFHKKGELAPSDIRDMESMHMIDVILIMDIWMAGSEELSLVGSLLQTSSTLYEASEGSLGETSENWTFKFIDGAGYRRTVVVTVGLDLDKHCALHTLFLHEYILVVLRSLQYTKGGVSFTDGRLFSMEDTLRTLLTGTGESMGMLRIEVNTYDEENGEIYAYGGTHGGSRVIVYCAWTVMNGSTVEGEEEYTQVVWSVSRQTLSHEQEDTIRRDEGLSVETHGVGEWLRFEVYYVVEWDGGELRFVGIGVGVCVD